MDVLNRPRFKRLKSYWEAKGFRSATDFAAFLEVGKSHISDIDNKETPAVLLQALSLKTSINLHWLLTGEGEMEHAVSDFMISLDNVPLRELIREFSLLSESDQWRLVADVKRWLAEQDKKRK